jgi:hypothetical protein
MNSTLNLVMRFGGIAARADQSYIPPTKRKTRFGPMQQLTVAFAKMAHDSWLARNVNDATCINQRNVLSGCLLWTAFGGVPRGVPITASRILNAAIIYPSLEPRIVFRRGGGVQSNSRSGYRNAYMNAANLISRWPCVVDVEVRSYNGRISGPHQGQSRAWHLDAQRSPIE